MCATCPNLLICQIKVFVFQVDIDFFITGVSALLKLIQSEAGLMQGIIPMKHERKVFDNIVQAGLDSIVKEGKVCFGCNFYLRPAALL